MDRLSASATPDGLTWATAFREIQPALTAAIARDEVWVARGTYHENVTVATAVGLYGGFAGTETTRAERLPKVNQTILNGGGTENVLTVDAFATTPMVIDGFTIRNAFAYGGSGIQITRTYYLTIANCDIRLCAVGVNGLPTYCSLSNSSLIANDRGVVVTGGKVINNVFYGNDEAVYQTGTASVVNNTFAHNGVGVQANVLSGSIDSNIFYRNEIAADQMKPTTYVNNNCTFENGKSFVGITDPIGTRGNIEADPRMVASAVGEFHLKAGSPCVDTGVTSSGALPPADMDGQLRKVGLAPDIGADEFDGTVWTATPAVMRVSPTGDDANNGDTWTAAKRTLPSAVDSLWGRGGEVWVAGGVYDEPATVTIPISLYGRFAVTDTIQSERSGGASVLRGGEWNAALTLHTAAGTATVDGFTVRDARNGILVVEGAPKVANCVAIGNVEGITVESGDPVFVNNTVLGNALGVALYGGTAAVTNTLIVANDAGVRVDADAGGTVTLRYSCVSGPVRFEGMADPGTANGNITAAPMLTAPELAYVHLLPGSPGIDAGDDAAAVGLGSDIDNQPRQFGMHVDIGADEADGVVRNVVPSTVFVSPTGDDANDGSDWSRPMRSIQAAVDAASVRGARVWVAAGTYAESVKLRPFTYLYGGFAGTETNANQRNVSAHPTVLTSQDWAGTVHAMGGYRFAGLDGFTIRDSGTGVRLADSSASVTNNTFTACVVAVDSSNGSPLISGNTVYANHEGLDFTGGTPVILNNRITSQLQRGVAVWNAAPTLRNNAVAGSGDAGLYLVDSDATVANNTLTGHRMAISLSGGQIVATNNIVAHNQTGVKVSVATDPMTLTTNCLFDNATPFAGMEAPPAEGGNFTADPKIAGYEYGGSHIQPDSPCVDAGRMDASAMGDTDIDGQARVMNGQVDIGADESAGVPVGFSVPVIHVSPDGDDANAGETWASAKRTVQAAIDATPGGEVWVAAGTYPESLRVRPFVYLYGGFAGTEADRAARDTEAHETTLTGDSTLTTIRFRGGYTFGKVDGFVVRSLRPAVSSVEGMPTITGNRVETSSTAIMDLGGAAEVLRNRVRYAGGSGSGIYLEGSASLVSGNTVTGPGLSGSAPAGGIYVLGGAPVLASNAVTDCPTGIYADSASAQVLNNTVVRTSTGLYLVKCAPTVVNNIVAEAAWSSIVTMNSTAAPVIRNNNLPGSAFVGTFGNIGVDPLFVNAANGDFRLRPASPAIDAGDDAYVKSGWTDADGQPRILFGHVDMGAYELARPGILPDAALALRIAAGLHAATTDEAARLSPAGTPDPGGIDVADAVRIIQQVTAGLR